MLLAKKILEFHAQVQKCQFGKNEKLPKWHFWTRAWNSKIFLAKSIRLRHYENGDKKFFRNMSQGLPNPGFMQEKVQKGDFLKIFSCFRFLWISRRPGTLNWEQVVFLPSKNLYRKCDKALNLTLLDGLWTYHYIGVILALAVDSGSIS